MTTSQTNQSPVPRDAFADLLPVQARYIAPGEYQMMDADGRQNLFYVEGSALAEWLRDRINESEGLCKENEALRECLELTAREAHCMGGYHAPNFVSFEDCQKTVCVRARAALTQPGILTR